MMNKQPNCPDMNFNFFENRSSFIFYPKMISAGKSSGYSWIAISTTIGIGWDFEKSYNIVLDKLAYK